MMTQEQNRIDRPRRASGGMKTFLTIWFGQTISQTGTAMSRFALAIWAYEQTGQATTLSLMLFANFILYVLLSPAAGVLADRVDRRVMMIAADTASGVLMLMIALLFWSGDLAIWHLFIAELLAGAFDAFHQPAWSASISTLVPKAQYGRASGLRSLGYSLSRVGAPFLAGVVLSVSDLGVVLILDLATFATAMLILAIIRIPRPPASETGKSSGEGFRQQVIFGFRYIFARPGLVGLLVIFSTINFTAALTYSGVMPAMILARTGGDELALALVRSALGVAGVIGGLALSAWGGPKRRIHGVLAGAGISFLLGDFLMGTGQTVAVWIIAALVTETFVPFIVGCNRAIWQSKVPLDVQGRVLSVQVLVQDFTMPLGYLVAGPLADRLFEPAMMPGGWLAGTFGGLVGTGPGAGMGLMFVCTAIIGATVSLGGYLIPAVRRVEHDLPDHDEAEIPAPPVAGGYSPLTEPVREEAARP